MLTSRSTSKELMFKDRSEWWPIRLVRSNKQEVANSVFVAP